MTAGASVALRIAIDRRHRELGAKA